MKRILAFVAVLGIFGLGTCLLADDADPPSWRGLYNATYQEWDFNSSTNPLPAETVSNRYGTPLMTITDGTYLTEYQGRAGVWEYSSGGMAFDLPNNPDLGPEKWIRIQVTYWDDPGSFNSPSIGSSPAGDGGLVDEIPHLDNWKTVVVDFTLTPNPPSETILLGGNGASVYIDQVVIDTTCVPEPGMLMLLATAGLSLFGYAWRRCRR